MKIITHQAGGQIKFVDYIPVVQDVYSRKGATTASSSGKKDSEDLIGKSIQKALEQNGLESDVAVFAQYAEAILQNSMYGFNDGSLNGSIAQLFKLRSLANKVRNSNELYETALSHMKSANTSSDYAVSSDGKIYALFQDDEGNAKVDAIRLDTYKENAEKYRLITNSELLEYRRLNKAFDDSMLQDIIGSIGMEEIVSDINGVISKFGKRNTSSYQNLSESVAKGMEYLFKINIDASAAYQDIVEDGEKKKDISAAIKYIYSSLNNNAKNVLKLHAELNDTSVVEYLKDAITLNTSYKYKEDIEKAPKGKGSGSGSGGDGLKTTQSWANMVMEDNGRIANFKTIVNKSTLAFNFPGYIYDGISTKDDKSLDTITSVSDTFMNLANQGLTDSSKKVYFGNIAIETASVGKDILIDNTRGGSVRYLPVDDSGNLSFSMMQQMAEIQNEIVKNRITDQAQIKKIWEDAGFLYSPKMNTGVPKGMRLARFWVQDGYTNEATASFNDPFWGGASPLHGNQFFEKVDNATVNQLITNYNNTQEKAGKVGFDIGGFAGMYTDSYRGSIFIPINEDQKQALVLSDKGYIEKPDYDRIKADQDKDRITSQWQTSASDLD